MRPCTSTSHSTGGHPLFLGSSTQPDSGAPSSFFNSSAWGGDGFPWRPTRIPHLADSFHSAHTSQVFSKSPSECVLPSLLGWGLPQTSIMIWALMDTSSFVCGLSLLRSFLLSHSKLLLSPSHFDPRGCCFFCQESSMKSSLGSFHLGCVSYDMDHIVSE